MGRPMVLDVCGALLVGALMGAGAQVLWDPAGAAPGAPVQVAGAVLDRPNPVRDDVVSAAAAAAVVEVETFGCGSRRRASATLLRDRSGRALLLTNAHVVRGAAVATVTFGSGTQLEVPVLGAVPGRDAALLDPAPVTDAGVTPLTIGATAALGDTVTVAGHPGGTLRVEAASVQEVQRRAGYGSASDVLLIGTEAEGGHSGGAVLDADGSVVGLVAARDPGTRRVVAYRIDDVLAPATVRMPAC